MEITPHTGELPLEPESGETSGLVQKILPAGAILTAGTDAPAGASPAAAPAEAPAAASDRLGEMTLRTGMIKMALIGEYAARSAAGPGEAAGSPQSKPWSPPNYFVNPLPDGGFQIVDAAGKPVPAPPEIKETTDAKGNKIFLDPWGDQIQTLYPPPGKTPPAHRRLPLMPPWALPPRDVPRARLDITR